MAVVGHGWASHDERRSWAETARARSSARGRAATALGEFHHLEGDLAQPDEPGDGGGRPPTLVGPLDVLGGQPRPQLEGTLAEITADELDASWAVNARASVLLVQAFAAQHAAADRWRVRAVHLGPAPAPMAAELPYAVTKGAIQQMILSLSDGLIDRASPSTPQSRTGGHRLGHAGDGRPGRSGAAPGPVDRPDEVAEVVAGS